jgi:hypothetical protein
MRAGAFVPEKIPLNLTISASLPRESATEYPDPR